ncbi:hypothetical protein AZI98_08935 [Aeribacillus pallidus]|uniref:Uncharacterized protein n=1 Tax=Aeribacillus pallidus TaxID=33936 RepID=A0A161ZSV4_9BACI|nr:hypothetical protein [Aeribacillus pallidus]KZN96177.1 hypothetical protein AZI98_08935 [Aeribacillus pallidus]
METDLKYYEVLRGYKRFSRFVKSDINKLLLINTVNNCINGSEWPRSYYNLRDEYLPELLGEEASKFFFWFALGGDLVVDEELKVDEEDIPLLNYIRFNFSQKFIKAKKFNINPNGFSEVYFTHGAEKDRFNTYIMRNDDMQFMLRSNAYEFISMMKEMLDYFSQMVESDVINIDDEDFVENLFEMKTSLESILEKVSGKDIENGSEQ